MSRPYRPSMKINPKLRVAAGMVETMVPDYDIKQSDPVLAAEKGVGNCVSKAVIGGLLLKKAMLLGPEPALSWNQRTHPKVGEDMFGRTKVLNGHAQLLATTIDHPHDISALSFNPDGVQMNDWEVYDFNDGENYADVVDGRIQTTSEGSAVGFVIADWHTGGRRYHEALGQTESVFHKYSPEEITERVLRALQKRDLLLKLSS